MEVSSGSGDVRAKINDLARAADGENLRGMSLPAAIPAEISSAPAPTPAWRRWTEDVLALAIVRPFRLERPVLLRGWTPARFGLRAEAVELETEPGLYLRGWLLRAENAGAPARGTVVLLHGISSCKEATLPVAQIFARAGWRCLAYDSRAHGDSDGRWCTYGDREKLDVSRWLDALGGRRGPFVVWGTSMGGAVAIEALAHDPRLRCGIVESTFATLEEVSADYARRLFLVSDPRLSTLALAGAERVAGFRVAAARPELTARWVRQPVLMVHGTADRHIASAYGRRVYRNLRSPGSRWREVPGGGHLRLWRAGGAEYARALVEFLGTTCDAEGGRL